MKHDAISRRGILRAELRAQTHDVHQKLHLHPHFVALFGGSISAPDYVDLMQRFHGFYAPMEDAIARAALLSPGLLDGFTYVRRTPLLQQDLTDLGFGREDIARAPMCSQIAKLVTPETLGGVLYVIEGATLGAALIDRAAQKVLHAESTAGRSFWAWSRAHNKERWAATNAYLDHLEQQGHAVAAIVDGAQGTFAALADWLEPPEERAPAAEGVFR